MLGGIESWIIEGLKNVEFIEKTFHVDLETVSKNESANNMTQRLKWCKSNVSVNTDLGLSSDRDQLQLIKLLEMIGM